MSMGGWGVPGVGSDRTTYESELLWGGDQARNGVLWQSKKISSAAVDAANTPTTILRPGLLMGTNATSLELEDWDADATDGSQNLTAVLDTEMRMTDFDATAVDRVFRAIVARAPLKSRKLLIEGVAFLGHANEYLARRQLAMMGCVLDDDPQNHLSGLNRRTVRVTAAGAYTALATNNGALHIFSNAAAVAITLPALQVGLSFDFLREGDEEIVVSSAEGDNIIVGNDAAADSITFTTAGNHIGAMVHVESLYVGASVLWLMTLPNVPIGTGVNTLPFALAT